MASENPFEVSSLYGVNASIQKPYASPFDFDLEDNLVVCGSQLILPRICVHTGVTDDLVQEERKTEFPSMKVVIVQRSCSITLFVSRTERARRQKVALILITIGATGFLTAIAALLLQERRLAILFPIGVVVACVSLFLFNRWNMPLQLVRYRAPGIHWVKGFSQSFLEALALSKLTAIGQSTTIDLDRERIEANHSDVSKQHRH